MMPRIPIIERTYVLARSGRYRTTLELKTALRAEGYERIEQHFTGRGLLRTLLQLMAEAHLSGAESAESAEGASA